MSWKVAETPWTQARLTNGSSVTPLVTLTHLAGGVSHIIQDGKDFVLINQASVSEESPNGLFNMSPFWFPDAIAALFMYAMRNWTVTFIPPVE